MKTFDELFDGQIVYMISRSYTVYSLIIVQKTVFALLPTKELIIKFKNKNHIFEQVFPLNHKIYYDKYLGLWFTTSLNKELILNELTSKNFDITSLLDIFYRAAWRDKNLV